MGFAAPPGRPASVGEGGLVLRDYQRALVEDIRAAWSGGARSIIAWLPTGAGKTEVSAHLAIDEAKLGGCTLFVVDRKTLAGQASSRYSGRYGILTDIIRGEDTLIRGYAPAIVASVQSLKSRRDHADVQAALARVTLIVVDEAHIKFRHHEEIMSRIPGARVLGLTATPLRDGLGLVYQRLVKGPSYQKLIDDGYLVRPRFFMPHVQDVKRGLAHVGIASTGDYVTSELSELMRRKTIIGDIVSTWREKSSDRQTIAFCVDIAHSQALRDDFVAAGVSAEHIDMHTAEDERRAMFERFRRGDTRILCSIVVLAVGFDEPIASCAILARPTLSWSLHIQQVGRVMRPHEGKRDCLILDHAGNVFRHGKVEEFDPPALSDIDKTTDKRKRAELAADYFPCPTCSAVMSTRQRVCHECGREVARKSHVDFVPGELTETPTGTYKGLTDGELRELYLELRGVAEARGWKAGYAFVKLKDVYGFKAPFAWNREPPREPSLKTLNLVRSWSIAYGKATGRNFATRAGIGRGAGPSWTSRRG
jgi:superfamily II DNA or RNA helicase